MNGIVLVNKEKNMSSHDVVARLRRILKTKKVGHCGTLDPMATGVLVCLINKATKLSNYLVLDKKRYIATFKLGQATTTQDLEGEVVDKKEYQYEYNDDDILKILEDFKGVQMQIPSIYSAIKVNGKKLYEYARNNEKVEIPQREINILNLELLSFEDDLITIDVECSSGTYIRSLCFDIAKKLGYPGVLVSLNRIESGVFKLEDSYTLNDIENNEYKYISMKDALSGYKMIDIDETMYNDVKNGKALNIEVDEKFVVVYQGDIQAIYDKSSNGLSKMIRGLW
ncbi:tRNA pseudouridine55 synthase [Bacilli bacterium PM5-9]|nr:tRNA pseudouridine55 synthase [Bacilli bacterium PM5-9]